MRSLDVRARCGCRPGLAVLDGGAAGVGPDELVSWARAVSDRSGAAFTSRSYRFPYALVAWHCEPVGVDVERDDGYPAGFVNAVCTPTERATYDQRAPDDAELTALWSGKEALAKALGDAVAYDPRRLESPLHWPEGRAQSWRAEQVRMPLGYSAWICWREPAGVEVRSA
ncbi:MAG: 4-phosphopantetheinyl transferase family protein [Acidimicrobiia bacterium]|nr:4-phosphopantetheinyl transferase family protein [Acidimicrobiia bacterium]